ncbi:histidine phosphatase family protein [Pseudalkalibacillus caeni]|uniref:Phosphoglycerate mutase family protein n=1 Tax=Exobacillus caeni TaxID=2574798 RepID=A0A5R9FB64_9BACL|nr:phosphoglycerate mutase family protein [Pseudalkalibacillus caeni]TLS38123.1 phosphoglycerate mutase family protein [Pseudalkalibacillus caeni]
MRLVAIRHLPTDWNKKGLLQGRRDIPISLYEITNYKAKIFENKKQLKQAEPFDLILTSSLIRTQQTAEQYGYQATTIEPLLDELDFGIYEGRPKSEMINETPEWVEDPLQLSLGEKLVDFEGRIITFLQKYSRYDSILLFGHGSWIRAVKSIEKVGNINLMNRILMENNQLEILADLTEAIR